MPDILWLYQCGLFNCMYAWGGVSCCASHPSHRNDAAMLENRALYVSCGDNVIFVAIPWLRWIVHHTACAELSSSLTLSIKKNHEKMAKKSNKKKACHTKSGIFSSRLVYVNTSLSLSLLCAIRRSRIQQLSLLTYLNTACPRDKRPFLKP